MNSTVNLGPIDTGVKPTEFNPNTYFNNLSNPPISVATNVSHAVLSFFEEYTGNKQSAEVLASAVIFTSASQGINPMETLQEFMNMPKGQIDDFLITLLNFNRFGTSLLGSINTLKPSNQMVKRTILV